MAATKSTSKAVAKNKDAALAELYGDDAGAGFEETTSEDYALPFLKLLQKMSPEVDEDSGAHVEGAKPGMYYDTGTGEVVAEVDFIPCHYTRAMVEWRDRDEGGGFVAQHPVGFQENLERETRGGRQTGRWVTDAGTYVADTRYVFGLRVKEDGDLVYDVLAFTSTQTKKIRNWMNKLNAMKGTRKDGSRFVLPIYANVWRLSSVGEENEQGSWKGYKIEHVGPVTDAAIVEAARAARDVYKTAGENVKPPETTQEAAHTGTGSKGTVKDPPDEVPF